ncbi:MULTISPECIES: isocitrate/isopropylmalate dehydrogenase family protein [Hymenobacter]|uniref:NAD-dependent isocitrate dehydrogenase n=1 Tax=Hymenobacter jejuensis TaxID=2502781 RepID=A0A5B7ZXW9_9BACT|nr:MULTISPECIES: isocitrate/isopropylmalate family dehydrogenase [Hymenobacter]MBC6991687.1 NAD-dependent isocitrate dehydrogenase [Hymenobacter sp. BT491]QDA60014.1 NAD-dependent isocitrate dehydrogenase [Hymenobacter jejuensis]
MHLITLIPGDGIGPEITKAVTDIFAAAQVPVQWEEQNAGQTTFDQSGELIPQALLDSLEKNRVALKGPITTPVGKGFRSINVTLRQKYDLYQNVRPSKTTEGIKTRYEGIDLVLFRENTEGLYSGLEVWDERLGIADAIARVTVAGSRKICRAAFAYAAKHGRKKVTLAHKANIIKMAGTVMLNACREAANEFPQIVFEDKIIDNMCMQLVGKPEQFDVIVTTNLFGDLLSDLCAGLVGGLGVVAGANIGDNMAIFEAVHGSAPDIAGQGKANPTALLRSALMMLHHIGEHQYADRIEKALEATLKNKEKCTGDLGGSASTSEFAQAIIDNLAKN